MENDAVVPSSAACTGGSTGAATRRKVPGSLVALHNTTPPRAEVLMSLYELDGTPMTSDPRHALTAQGTAVLPLDLSWTVAGRYLENNDGPDDFRNFFVLDTRLDWQHGSGWFVGVTGTNLLDRRYEEVPGVQMPGILFTGTVGRAF